MDGAAVGRSFRAGRYDGAARSDRAGRPDRREPPLRAASSDQQTLLELQAVDTRLDQLAHRRRSLPELAEVDKLDRALAELRDGVVIAQTQASDLERARVKAEADVEQVRARARRNQQRLDTGQVGSPRDLQNLQSEVASLARRQSALEDVELEVMERLEETQQRLADLVGRREGLDAERADAGARRDAAISELDRQVAEATDRRASLAGQVDAALLALYDKLRGALGGVGAAALSGRRCSGCQLELDVTEVNAARAAPEDEVLRHEECRRILVRTPASGL